MKRSRVKPDGWLFTLSYLGNNAALSGNPGYVAGPPSGYSLKITYNGSPVFEMEGETCTVHGGPDGLKRLAACLNAADRMVDEDRDVGRDAERRMVLNDLREIMRG